jgi:hypothetical protein
LKVKGKIMKQSIKTVGVSIVASILLIGCGSSDTATSTQNSNTGTFIDSAVAGLEYNTSSGFAGVTDRDGKFQYNNGESVSFALGKLHFGTAKPSTDGLITPKLLVVGDASVPTDEQKQKITLMLQTLQSLDIDNNSSNGITIDPNLINKLADLTQEIQLQDLNETQLITLDNEHDLGLDKDFDGSLDVNATEATEHFDASMQSWENTQRPEQNSSDTTNNSKNSFDLAAYPMSTSLTQDLKDSLAYMGNEERLAYDVYMNLYSYHLKNNNIEIKQLKNIAQKAESKHISIVQDLVKRYNLGASDLTEVTNPIADNNITLDETLSPNVSGKYDIQKIQDLYNSLYALGIQDKESALKVGCMVEVTDIDDLDKYLSYAQESNAADIEAAFNVLRDGSYNHYWAFDKGLKNIGIDSGCCSLGDVWCHPEYPQNEKGNNTEKNGQGKGGASLRKISF